MKHEQGIRNTQDCRPSREPPLPHVQAWIPAWVAPWPCFGRPCLCALFSTCMALSIQETTLGFIMGTPTPITLTHSLPTHPRLVLQLLHWHAADGFLSVYLLCVPFSQLHGFVPSGRLCRNLSPVRPAYVAGNEHWRHHTQDGHAASPLVVPHIHSVLTTDVALLHSKQ